MSKSIIVKVDESLHEAVKTRAGVEGMNMSEFVRGAIREALSREPWKPVFRPATNLEFRYGGNTE